MQAIDGGQLDAERLSSWAEVAAKYRAALCAEKRSDMERALAQNAVNPAYVARNHVMQAAIARAEAGDYSEVCITKSSAASDLKLMLMTMHWRGRPDLGHQVAVMTYMAPAIQPKHCPSITRSICASGRTSFTRFVCTLRMK